MFSQMRLDCEQTCLGCWFHMVLKKWLYNSQEWLQYNKLNWILQSELAFLYYKRLKYLIFLETYRPWHTTMRICRGPLHSLFCFISMFQFGCTTRFCWSHHMTLIWFTEGFFLLLLQKFISSEALFSKNNTNNSKIQSIFFLPKILFSHYNIITVVS